MHMAYRPLPAAVRRSGRACFRPAGRAVGHRAVAAAAAGFRSSAAAATPSGTAGKIPLTSVALSPGVPVGADGATDWERAPPPTSSPTRFAGKNAVVTGSRMGVGFVAALAPLTLGTHTGRTPPWATHPPAPR